MKPRSRVFTAGSARGTQVWAVATQASFDPAGMDGAGCVRDSDRAQIACRPLRRGACSAGTPGGPACPGLPDQASTLVSRSVIRESTSLIVAWL
jgi:hypothetical protein